MYKIYDNTPAGCIGALLSLSRVLDGTAGAMGFWDGVELGLEGGPGGVQCARLAGPSPLRPLDDLGDILGLPWWLIREGEEDAAQGRAAAVSFWLSSPPASPGREVVMPVPATTSTESTAPAATSLASCSTSVAQARSSGKELMDDVRPMGDEQRRMRSQMGQRGARLPSETEEWFDDLTREREYHFPPSHRRHPERHQQPPSAPQPPTHQ